MVHSSPLSLLSSSPASVCSLPSHDSNSPLPTNSDWPSSSTLPFLSISKRNNSGLSKFKLKASADNGSAGQFLQNNSIADFMRFIKRGGQSSSELQTAVVSYRRKFPWSLLQPFLQVDLVSTIHIADKEYFETLQKELELYDCVLYEMVASRESLEDRRNPAYRRPSGI